MALPRPHMKYNLRLLLLTCVSLSFALIALIGCDRTPTVESLTAELENGEGGVILEYRIEDSPNSESVRQTLSTVRKRLKVLELDGVRVTQRGSDEFIIVLPGIEETDIERVKRLIGWRPELRIARVDDDGTEEFFTSFTELPEGLSRGNAEFHFQSVMHAEKDVLRQFFAGQEIPEGRTLGYQYNPQPRDGREAYWETLLLFDDDTLTGEHLSDARVMIDEGFNQPYVAIKFDEMGTSLLTEVTASHQGKRLAILLDDEVKTAPLINEPIRGGRVQVTMGAMLSFKELQDQSTDLVVMLRSQSLTAPVQLTGEQSVP